MGQAAQAHSVVGFYSPQPTKASLSHCRPPAEAEVAVAPGACHLMTILARPDVPQTLQH